jgi:hypothetical protein
LPYCEFAQPGLLMLRAWFAGQSSVPLAGRSEIFQLLLSRVVVPAQRELRPLFVDVVINSVDVLVNIA